METEGVLICTSLALFNKVEKQFKLPGIWQLLKNSTEKVKICNFQNYIQEMHKIYGM